ncbi:MAG: MucB/RseB C-terminal domain-containing protein [Pseudomonadales bacterium]|jgi:sigma-E factor negative regulatory protein RseB|nr:MucB/RseB C-terminal domain-containing protein [Pseudomonadales bacterium]
MPRLVHALRHTALLVQCIALAAAAAPVEGPEQWLQRMDDALGTLDYRGEFSYLNGRDLSSLSIRHAILDGVARERLTHLDGPPRELIRTGDDLLCVMRRGDPLAELGRQVPTGPITRSFVGGFSVVPEAYRARAAGEGRIARRSARVIELLPVDDSRYGYRLWIDAETALPLRSELLDPSGRALEVFQFVNLEVGGSFSLADFAPPAGDQLEIQRIVFADGAPSGDRPIEEAWEAGWLPGGFAMAARDLRRLPFATAPVDALLYSDGLASFSVFVERLVGHAGYDHSSQLGGTVAVVRRLEMPDDRRWLVTVVGEVPLATAERVARSVQPRGD